MTFPRVFQLSIQRIDHRCTFELSGGATPRQTCQIDYPSDLDSLYQAWHNAYLGYYQQLPPYDAYLEDQYQLRGEKVTSGQISSEPIPAAGSPRKHLVEAEVRLLDTFHRWLRSVELYDIRAAIAKAVHHEPGVEPHWVDVCLRCSPLNLARLPWETWEIGTELGIPRRIRIAREPQNIRHDVTQPIRRQARILAIVGGGEGLNLEKDIEAISSLKSIARVKLFDCQREGNSSELLQKICQKIENPKGWDILFFVGHSNESPLTGGEIRVSGTLSLSIRDIESSLKVAKQNGLQFAVFNSCQGLDLAKSLINLGLSQVAIMREPIHDRVAHLFIKQFLISLAGYKDVHEALLDACEYLKQQDNKLRYPSAYAVSSLFRHPSAELFRIQPFSWSHRFQRRLPKRGEAIGLAACLLASLLPPVQELLLDGRLWAQARYRQLTGDIPSQVEAPILLVQIDPQSLAVAEIENPRPIPQDYLADIIEALTDRNASIVGIDYLLDDAEAEPTPEQRAQLKQAIAQTAQSQTQLVFAYDATETAEYTRQGFVSDALIDFDQARHGDINFYPTLLDLPASSIRCGSNELICPFAYEVARLYAEPSSAQTTTPLVQSEAGSSAISWEQTTASLPLQTAASAPDHLFGITSFSELFLQAWFHPVLDFSLPPDKAYRTISACELLEQCLGEGNRLRDLTDMAVLIVPGGYEEAGIDESDSDQLPLPAALSVWQRNSFTGGEAHAYMLHHLLTDHRVYPIPDLFMVLLMAILAKELRLLISHHPWHRQRWAIAIVLASAYGLACLEIFRAAGIVVPIVLPTAVLWLYAYLVYRSGSEYRLPSYGSI
ncbi:MAG: CHASE2 domain-containing protein [Leptolyngbya sp. SIO4C5]|nr:CHASE2 domain-containing protein [Leptolyngbya sp. SIO4C5]